jgi:hypothetical protein
MGEAADDAIDRGIDEWLHGEYDDEGYYTGRTKTCRNCGVSELQWGFSNGHWRLFDANGALHVCVSTAKKAFK